MNNPNPVSLSDTEISYLEELSHIKRYHLRCKIVLFTHLGYEPREIAVQLHCHIHTVWDYIKAWKKSGFEGLKIKTDEKKT